MRSKKAISGSASLLRQVVARRYVLRSQLRCSLLTIGTQVIFTQLIGKVPAAEENAGRTLILAHRRELVEQAVRHCERVYPDKVIEVEMGDTHASGTADITVASVMSITSGDRLEKFDPSTFKLVLVDEAHHIVAPSYLRTLEHFGLDEKRPTSPLLVGVSATFSRFDGVKLGVAIDEIVYHRDYVDMISENWLSNVVFTTVESTANLSRVRKASNGDFRTGELSEAVNTDKINEITVRAWLAKVGRRKSTLVFCVDLAHVSSLARAFRKHGLDARVVSGHTPKQQRASTIDDFRAGKFPILLNCSVFTEGTDIPNIDCIVLARPTKSRNLLVQMIGRGMRLHPGKNDCHVIDLVSTLETGVVTTPTLFGLDPRELLDHATMKDMERIKKRDQKQDNEFGPTESLAAKVSQGDDTLTFTDYSSVLDLIADTSGERHIRSISDYAWVQVGPDRFVLSSPGAGYIRIERILEQTTPGSPSYRAVEVRSLPAKLSRSPFAAPREILTAITFTDAVHGADQYASKKYPHNYIGLYQPWRKTPPTDSQLEYINKIRGEGRAFKPEDITKGKAADMITKLKHGARGHFKEIEMTQRRLARQQSRLKEEAGLERVQVGPLAA